MGSGTANTQETQSSTGQSKEQRQLCEQPTPDTSIETFSTLYTQHTLADKCTNITKTHYIHLTTKFYGTLTYNLHVMPCLYLVYFL